MKQIKSIDEKTYNIKSFLSQDGNGSLYALENSEFLRIIDDSYLQKYLPENFLKNVQLLSACTRENNIAIPNDFISEPVMGYVFHSGNCDIPLSSILWNSNKGYSRLDWMKKTGDVLRRINILVSISELLAKFHQDGFVLCNLSPSNILIQENVNSYEVFLASTEWVRYKAEAMKVIYTDRYTAPEVSEGFITNTYTSDCYSFALMVFELLAFKPIIPSDITADDIKACPYITSDIQQMLEASLIKGRNNPDSRSEMDEWKNCLENSLSRLILCPKCGITYPYIKGRCCPECKTYPSHVYSLAIRFWNEVTEFKNAEIRQVMDLMDENEHEVILDPNTSQPITGEWLDERLSDAEIATVTILQHDSSDFLCVAPAKGTSLYVSISLSQSLKVDKEIKIRLKKDTDVIMISLNDLSTSQNVIVIDKNGLFD